MKTWFTSDTHFALDREVDPRGFRDVREMDDALVRNWNARVAPGDTVWHLGDFGCGVPLDRLAPLFEALNGRKLLVVGNWDEEHPVALSLAWDAPPEKHALVEVDGTDVFLCHYPSLSWPRMRDGSLHLYGHTHGYVPGSRRSLDVGVDAWGCRPVGLDEARARMATLPEGYGLLGVDVPAMAA